MAEPVQVRTPQGRLMTIRTAQGAATLMDSDGQPLAMAGAATDQAAIDLLCRQFGLRIVVLVPVRDYVNGGDCPESDDDPAAERDYDPDRDADQPGDQGEADAKDDARYVFADDHRRPPRGGY